MNKNQVLALFLGAAASRKLPLPTRPDEIQGFRFEQGKCMTMRGTDYMDSRWSFEGNYVDDGITYEDCAQKCRDREECAGFDVWHGNNDCQLFLYEAFFGDGSHEEECFLKDGFVVMEVPQPPQRPAQIEGFRFEQGNCMPKSGGGYHSSKYSFEGTYWDDGIDYQECAKRCRDEPNCAAFDVWLPYHDCELFFDKGHYGDGDKGQECFINENAVLKGEFTEAQWSGFFDMFCENRSDDKYCSLNEFINGWKSQDSDPDMDKVKLNFRFADADGDGRLSREEFMALRTVVASQAIDAFMLGDENGDRKLDLGEFGDLWKLIEADVQDGMVYTGYKIGDTNEDRLLDFDEFRLLSDMKQGNYYGLNGNVYSHIEYNGFRRQDGYCKKPGDEGPDEEDWMETGITNIGSCSTACKRDRECNAWTWYHEDGNCYFFKPNKISREGFMAENLGVCFVKE